MCCVAAVAALLGLFIFVYPLVTLFIFHGASRDGQAGVAPKLSPAVAFLTKLLRRKLGQGKGKHPAAVAPSQPQRQQQPDAVMEIGGPRWHEEEVVAEAVLVCSDSDDDTAGGAWAVHPAPQGPQRASRATGQLKL
jgi:hypothetical protein